MSKKVTILVPNYKTISLTKLCLRLIRKHTSASLAHVIVIDNDSNDESLSYLRTLRWIELIERQAINGEGAISAHARALDLGLSRVTTPYVLSIHTDTLVKNPAWLDFLIEKLESNENIAGVGSWKLERRTFWRQSLKQIEQFVQLGWYKCSGKTKHGIEGIGGNYFYLRSHCAMYRAALLKQYALHFSDGGMVAGKYMHQKLLQAGHDLVFLPSAQLIQYVEHINHATSVINPELSTRPRSIAKGRKRIEKSLAQFQAEKIWQDDSLDG